MLFLHKDNCGYCEKMIFQLDEKNNIIGMIDGLYLIGDISVKSGGSIAKAIQDGYQLVLKLFK